MSAVGQVMSALSVPKEATRRVVAGLARDWAGVPRGPLGRVSTRWVMPRLHAAVYQVMAPAVQLRADPDGTTTHLALVHQVPPGPIAGAMSDVVTMKPRRA